MATNEAELTEKERFFNRLSALDEGSDEEQDTNDVRDVLRNSKRLSPSPPFSTLPVVERVCIPAGLMKPPGLQRTASAPTPGLDVQDTPKITRKSLLRRSESATPSSSDLSIVRDIPESILEAKPCSVSNPTLGTDSLVLNYSTGIESMLGKRSRNRSGSLHPKKKLRKENSIKLVPENEQIFKGQTFYYIPPDSKSPLRRTRITKVREFGATYTESLTPNTTHIVVDKEIIFRDVMTFLKLETLPPNLILVTEEYPIDSINCRYLLDPTRNRYAVNGHRDNPIELGVPLTTVLQTSNVSLEIEVLRSLAGRDDYIPPNDTPPRSQESSRAIRSKGNMKELSMDLSRAGSILHNVTKENFVGESHEGKSQSAEEAQEFEAPVWPSDELDQMIKVTRSLGGVPIDDEDDLEGRTPSPDDPEDSASDDNSHRPTSRSGPIAKRKESDRRSFDQTNFSCMIGGTGNLLKSNPNSRVIEILQKMADYYVETKDHWRQTAYRKAIGTLKRQLTKITTYEEAINLPTVGHRIALKIEEIVLTNGLQRLDNAMSETNYQTLSIFVKIYGVGINQAWKWVQQGNKTLEDLKAHVHLSENQRLGIERYDDLLTLIPREEVSALGSIVKLAASILDPNVDVIIGGSYRRGASSSGDIDCLLTKKHTSSSHELLSFLYRLVRQLTESGFLVAALAEGTSKWHGCCVLPGESKPIWRRIDLLLVPETELGAALIYFTGDDIFNRSMRLLSSKKSMRLNQKGLYRDVMRGPGKKKMNEGELIEGADEKRIFARLGVPFRPPEQRICH